MDNRVPRGISFSVLIPSIPERLVLAAEFPYHSLTPKTGWRSAEALVDQAEQSALRSVSKKTEAPVAKKSRKKSRPDIQKGGFK
jgi:hypothetical protein